MNLQANWKYILVVVILAVTVGGGILVYSKDIAKEIASFEFPGVKRPEGIVGNETADWETYRNEEYNYEMKYPEDWTSGHSSGYDDEFGVYYESNLFKSPDESYVLFFGIVPKESNIMTPQLRTGVQAGDFIDADEAINIGGIEVGFQELVYEGKVKEIFFNSFEINGFKGGACLSYFGIINPQEYDMVGKPELDTAKRILSTFKFLD